MIIQTIVGKPWHCGWVYYRDVVLARRNTKMRREVLEVRPLRLGPSSCQTYFGKFGGRPGYFRYLRSVYGWKHYPAD